jgi:hypothetical protein
MLIAGVWPKCWHLPKELPCPKFLAVVQPLSGLRAWRLGAVGEEVSHNLLA